MVRRRRESEKWGKNEIKAWVTRDGEARGHDRTMDPGTCSFGESLGRKGRAKAR